ncbi:MAG: hypothetical protein CME71_01450 [Halobacteriovorax sp.]|nr:hypothetical protein [Halobacteriovorax sp.]
MTKIRPLESRPFRFKNATKKFHCPLCASERYLTSSHRMSAKHFLQIAVLTGVTTFALFDFMQWRALSLFFVFWAGYEVVRRLVYRSGIECPYCGFDASWYKRDVKVARRLVDEFWQKKNAESQKSVPPQNAP